MTTAATIVPTKSTNVRIPYSSLAAAGFIRFLGWSSPGISTRLAAWLWSHPTRYARPAREVAVLSSGEPMKIPYGMGGIQAWTWGKGPVILLVHGWEGRGSQLGSFVDPLVRAGFRVVTFDAPGHGDSTGDQASLFTFVDAIHTVARHVGPIHTAIAHSMGGASVLAALNSGFEVGRVVFLAPADASLAIGRFADTVGMSDVVRERLRDLVEARHGAAIESIRGDRLAASMNIPALVFHDDRDRFVPMSDAESISGAWPGAELRRTHGLGHHRILRDQQVVGAAIDFIAPGANVHNSMIEEILADLRWGRD